jgi:hypothetical protein
MDILQKLSSGHNKAITNAIVKYIGDDKERFAELVNLFLKGDYRITQRAAWPLGYVAIENPGLVKLYIGRFIKKLGEPGLHPAIPRNILRVFQTMDIPEKYRGSLLDICIRYITSENIPVAIRAFAITTAANICKHYPELKNELLIILNELGSLPQTPALRVRIKFALKALQKEHPKV